MLLKNGLTPEDWLLSGFTHLEQRKVLWQCWRFGDRKLMKYQSRENFGAKEGVFMLSCMSIQTLWNALNQLFILLHNTGILLLKNFEYIFNKVNSFKFKSLRRYISLYLRSFSFQSPFMAMFFRIWNLIIQETIKFQWSNHHFNLVRYGRTPFNK